MEIISSASNPKIKKLLSLQQKSSERRESARFVVEGLREILHCEEAGYQIDSLFVCPDILGSGLDTVLGTMLGASTGLGTHYSGSSDGDAGHRSNAARVRVFELTRELYEKVAYRGGTEGIIAEVVYKERKLNDLKLPDNALVVVIEGVEKPGNIGAILRSCDAAKADALIICDPRTDIYNPNLIRASIGAVFTVPCAVDSSSETIEFLQRHHFQILTAQLQDSSLYYDCDMQSSTAIVMGTEDKGLSPIWRQAASAHIRIPMLGHLDSLNVSVATAVLLFEALRQRQKP